SFLVWLDCRGLGLDHDALIDLFVGKAHLALNDGEMFGQGGQGFMRMNVGSPRAIIHEALERLRKAIG
ncbi:MAG: cystathionine beta-lyase, partial [Duncaniella sp.]|nr:cystathionine beta-lyase [Duncaniella sp.]